MLDNLLNANNFVFDIADSAIADGAHPPAAAQAPGRDQADGPVAAVPTPISGEFRVNTTTSDDQLNSSVAALDAGGFVVIWTSLGTDGDGSGLFGQRYTAAGVAEGIEFRVNTTTASDQAFASVASLDGGGFVVTWTSLYQDGSDYGIYGQRYAASGAAVGGEFRVNTVTSDSQLYSSVASLSDGGFVVVWESYNQDGSRSGVYGQRYSAAGATAGGEFRVNTFTANDQKYSAVIGLDGGGFVVTWSSYEQDGMDDGIYGQRYDAAGAAVGSEFRVNTYTTSFQYTSSVAALNGGGFVITWTSAGQDANDWGIYGQRYTAAGVAVGGEFRVNSTITGDQFNSSVTTLADGGFAVTWTSFGQDGDASGVYGQRYTAAGVADGGEFRLNQTTSGFQQQDDVPRQGVAQLAGGQLVAVWAGNGAGDAQGVYARQFSLGPVNAAPAGTDATLTITEDAARVLTVADFGFTDADGHGFLSVGITTLPGAGTITLNGTAVTAGTFVTIIDINAGLLVYTPGSNGAGAGYSSFTFQVRDNSVSANTDLSANTITFNVTAVNDAPTIANLQGDISTQTEGSGAATFADAGRDAVITDVDSANFDGGRLTVAVTSGFQADQIAILGDGILAVGAGNVVTVSGTAIGVASGGAYGSPRTATLTIDLNGAATVALVQTLLRGIFVRDSRIEPVGGTRAIEVTLTDGDGGSSSYTSQVDVIAINDEPFGTDTTVTINEDASHVFTRADFDFDAGGYTSGAFHVEEDQQFLTVRITTLPTAGTLTLNGANVLAGAVIAVSDLDAGNLVFRPATNASGTGYAGLTFQVQDDGGTANGGIDTDQSANTLTFNVTAVNDAPVSSGFDTITFVEDNPNAVPLDTGFDQILVDVDSPNFDGGTLTFRVSGGHVPTEDRLTFLPGGTSSLTVSGNEISYQGVAFATFSPGGLGLTRTFTFNANATVDAVQTLMRNLAYRNDNQYDPSTAQRTIEYILTDGDGGSQTLTSLVNVTAVNDVPVLDLNSAATGIDDTNAYLEGAPAAGIGASISISDDGGTLTRATVAITDAVAGDLLTVTLPLPAGITVDPASTATTLILVGTASTAAFATALGQVGYRSTSDDPTLQGADTSRSISVVVNDGVADSAPATMTMTVAAVNDAPVVTLSFNAPVIDQSALDVSSGHNISSFVQSNNFTVSGPTTLNRFTVFLAESTVATAGTFEGFGGTLSFAVYRDNGSGLPGTLISTGSDTAPVATDTGLDLGGRDLFQFVVNLGGIALASGNYWLALHEGAWLSPTDGTDIFWSRSANDTNNNQRANTSNVTAPNGTFATFTPGLAFAIDGTRGATEQTAFNLKGKIAVADPDAGSGSATVTLAVPYGVLNVNAGTSGATIVSGNGTGTVVLSGTIAQLNALLNSDGTSVVTFTADTDTPPANTALTVSINDNGSTGGGGAQTGMASQTIVITAINDAPVADLNGAAAGIDTTAGYTEGGVPVSPISGIVLSDPDNANLTGATVTIATGFVTGDLLRISSGLSGTTASGITYGYNSGTGVLTLTGSATVADYQAALATLSFKTTNDAPGTARNITVVINDGAASSTAANIALTVTPTNDAPVADLNGAAAGIDTTASYTEGGTAVSPIAGIVLSDPDSANLTGATVAIGAGFVAGDVLRMSGGLSGTTASGITFSYNATSGVLKLRGSASVADYQAALATLSFKSSSDDPGTARDITVVVNDGTANSVAAHIALTVTPVNDAPVNIVPADQTTTSGGSIVFSTANGNALSVSDPDVGSGQLRVKLAVTDGTVTLSGTANLTVSGDGTGVVVITGTAAAINAALQGLSYQSSPGYTGPAALKLTTSDLGNTGTGGILTDVDTVAITVQPQIASQEPGLGGAFDVTGLAPKTAGAAAVFDFAVFDFAGLAGLGHDSGGGVATSLDLAVQIEAVVWHDPLHSGSDFLL